MEVEAKDLIDIMRQQISYAMNEAALNAAIAQSLRKKIVELEAKLEDKDANG